eukprot:2073626-Alexandrium_andersonii.AAC.1
MRPAACGVAGLCFLRRARACSPAKGGRGPKRVKARSWGKAPDQQQLTTTNVELHEAALFGTI